MTQQLKILAQHNRMFFSDEVLLYIAAVDPKQPDMIGMAEPLVFKWTSRGSQLPSQATIGGMRMEDATQLMDSLWDIGIRPSRMPKDGGFDFKTLQSLHLREVDHLRSHIRDLRAISRHALGMEQTDPPPMMETVEVATLTSVARDTPLTMRYE